MEERFEMDNYVATDAICLEEDQCVLGPTERVVQHRQAVWQFLRALGCDFILADDLTQEAILRLLKHKEFQPINHAATASYLRRVAHNLVISHHHKHRRTSTTAELEVPFERWNGMDLDEDPATEALKSCLSNLTERSQKALIMKYGLELGVEEIGQELGISRDGAKNLLQRAKCYLRQCIQRKFGQLDCHWRF
ncbi:MAG: sigma-70 family RNA polymerase sigma factor [Planctomycetales bacterium]|nr:sigma-70 family RNA polymerase sigma factor [Planctomycetales bacterium]